MKFLPGFCVLSLATSIQLGDHGSEQKQNESDSDSFTLGVAGDILLYEENQKLGFGSKNGSYKELWKHLRKYLEWPDYTVGNIEGAVSTYERKFKNGIPKSYEEREKSSCVHHSSIKKKYGGPFHAWKRTKGDEHRNWMNYHPQLARDLYKSGFDLVSTATNHACDACIAGLQQGTLILKAAKLKYVGTRYKKSSPLSQITTINGLNVAWIACTDFVNAGWRESGADATGNQQCKGDNGRKLLSLCDEDFFSEIKRLKRLDSVDGVIAFVHGGIEYAEKPTECDHHSGCDEGPHTLIKKVVQKAVGAGAFLVLGNHPHVAQPITRMKREDGTSGTVVWSIGNFMSNKFHKNMMPAGMLYFKIRKEKGQLDAPCFQWMPICMTPDFHVRPVNMSDPKDECKSSAEHVTKTWPKNFRMDEPKTSLTCIQSSN